MRLKNSRGNEKEFNIILKIEKNKHIYLVYQDITNYRLYSGKLINNKLVKLNDDEFNYINNIVERVCD